FTGRKQIGCRRFRLGRQAFPGQARPILSWARNCLNVEDDLHDAFPDESLCNASMIGLSAGGNWYSPISEGWTQRISAQSSGVARPSPIVQRKKCSST